MIFISLIAAALLIGSFGKDFTECSFNESEETSCFAAAGKSLCFYLLNTDFVDLRLLKDGKSRIFKTVNGSVLFDDPYNNTANYFKNGTIQLNNVSKKDAGNYTLEEFDSKGKHLKSCSIHLKVITPVSVLKVSQECFTPEQRKVTCFFGGDEAELTMTLNDHLLLQSNTHSHFLSNDTPDRSSVFNVSIIIHEQLLGNIRCKVWNKVSRDGTTLTITACNGSQSVYVTAITVAVSLLVFAALSATLIKLYKKQRTVAVHTGDPEAHVIYAEVKVHQRKRKTEARLQNNA